mgnify:FL=1
MRIWRDIVFWLTFVVRFHPVRTGPFVLTEPIRISRFWPISWDRPFGVYHVSTIDCAEKPTLR